MTWLTYELVKDHIERLQTEAQQSRPAPMSEASREATSRLGESVGTSWRRLTGLRVLAPGPHLPAGPIR